MGVRVGLTGGRAFIQEATVRCFDERNHCREGTTVAESRPERRAEDEPVSDAKADEESSSNYLDDIEDGAGCTEIWEHLSNRREAESDGDEEEDD
jgi:hypothetical protein